MAVDGDSKIEKAERLLNLTLALLDTKRPLTKQQIFESVSGYSGKPDSMERMFERDKDELREIGIQVQVLPIDAYFDDEIGYRIIPEEYFLPPISFNQEETIWLALAANVIREFSPKGEAKSAVQKLLSRSEVDIDGLIEASEIGELDIPVSNSLSLIWRAMKEAKNIQFQYSRPGIDEKREIRPHVLTTRFGNWYVLAGDFKDNKLKTFRVDRMRNIEILINSKITAAVDNDEIENNVKAFFGEALEEVRIKVDHELPIEHQLFKRAFHIETLDNCKVITFKNVDAVDLKEKILWSIEHVQEIYPQKFATEIISGIERTLVANS